jgi:mitogen-activated protein kinase kinase kinase 3
MYEHLEHPNIIKFFGSEVLNDTLFIYLEYIPGGSIKYLLNKYGNFSSKIIKIYLKQILDGLEYLHSKGVVHRDIKSANILVDLKGNIKLSDFGVSGQISLKKNVGESGFLESLKGTLLWMAPEVICQTKYGKKADIWSLGCTLLEMATGLPPWGKLENQMEAILKIGKSNESPEIPSNLDVDMIDFLRLCFVRNPKERLSAEELKDHKFLNS